MSTQNYPVIERGPSLRDMQVSAILKMLFLNKDTENGNLEDAFSDQDILWKVLVLDKKSTEIISSILRVNDLLKAGITVHTLIKQDRAPLPDVSAVYFITPTEENIDLIVKDIKEEKYSEYYINFTSTLNRDLLEKLAQEIALIGQADKIKQVFDQYLDFVVTEPELFSLQIDNTYSQFNNRNATEELINTLCDKIADGLFNTVMTTNSIPIIRAPIGGPAEMVAEKLGNKIRDYVINTKSSGTSVLPNNDNLERGVLIILDRTIDFASMFAHSWIYQCMVFDIFKLSRNTITIPVKQINKNDSTRTNQDDNSDNNINNYANQYIEKQYDIEPTDFFWIENSHLPFPEAAENVEAALAQYKEEAAAITRKAGVTDITDLNPASNSDTLQIQEVVNKLPELTARKNIIDTHVNIFGSLLNELESKSLDTFFEIEQDPNNAKLRTNFMNILNDNKINNLNDKMRTFIYLFLTSSKGLPKEFVDEVEKYFKSHNYDISPLKYVYKLREYMQISSLNLQNRSLDDGQVANNNSNNAGYSLSKLYGLTEGKLPKSVGNLISGIKNLLPEKKTIPITNVVEAIMDPLNSSQKNLETTDSYLYIDPRITRGSHTKKPKRQSYNKSMVFVVGGGNYLEYQNLQEWAHSQIHNPKKVIYGSTAITPPDDFLKEISILGADD